MLSRDEYESALYARQKSIALHERPYRLRVREDNLAASTANMTHEQIAGLERAG